jgi:hypothetical protein
MTSSRRSAVESPEYQSLSALAVVALVLGVASLGVLAAPLLLVVAAAAVGCGLLSLAAIRKSDGAMAGGSVARLGMAIAVAAVAALLVRNSLRDSLLERQGAAFAEQWIAALADQRLEDARDMLTHSAKSALLPDPMSRQTPLTAEEADEISLRRLRDDPLTKALADNAEVIAEGAAAPEFDGPRAVVTANFVVGSPDGSHRHATVHALRDRRLEAVGQPWQIEAWTAGEAHGAH